MNDHRTPWGEVPEKVNHFYLTNAKTKAREERTGRAGLEAPPLRAKFF